MEHLEQLFGWIAEQFGLPFWTAPTALALGGLAFWVASRVLGGEKSDDWFRGEALGALERLSLLNRLIRRTILRFLFFQDRLFRDDTVRSRGRRAVGLGTALFGTRMTPWSFHCYDRLVLLAFLYPVAALVFTWFATGDARLGDTVVLPPDS